MQAGVIVIHGVGNPQYGELAQHVASNLAGSTQLKDAVLITECNWNTIVEKPLEGESLRFSAFREIAICLERTTQILHSPVRPSSVDSLLLGIYKLCIHVAEASLATVVGSIAILNPVLFVGQVFTETIPGGEISLVGWSWFIANLAAKALGLVCLGLITTGALRAAIQVSCDPLLNAVRSILLILCRPIILAGYFIFLLPWKSARRDGPFFVVASIGLSILLLLIGAIMVLFSEGTLPLRELAEGGERILIQVAILGLLLGLPVFITTAVGPTLKVLLDIFRYIGDSSYRSAIDKHLEASVEYLRSRGCGRFVLLAHSLGSVIALNSLVSSRSWGCNDQLVLVTMGSPIRRIFTRFFPNIFFPADISTAATVIAGRVKEFRWINCYRPLDQVGASLGFKSDGPAVEAGTRQWDKVISAHINYWGDSVVRDVVLNAIERSAPIPVCTGSSENSYSTPPLDAGFSRRIANTVNAFIFAAVVLLPILGFFYSAKSYLRFLDSVRDVKEDIEAEGVMAMATVEHRHVRDLNPDNFQDHDEFRVIYPPLKEPMSLFSADWVFSEIDYFVYIPGFVNLVRANCQSANGAPDRRGRWCKRDNVLIRYSQKDPSKFVVEGFPAQRRLWDEMRAWVSQILLLVTFPVGIGVILLWIFGRWVSLLVGDDQIYPMDPPCKQ